jgi:hypothetical protein
MSRRFLDIAARALIVGACFLGIWESWKFMRSDELYSKGLVESVRAAIHLEPDCWWCYVQLARLDESDAEALLQASLRLNAYNSDAAIDLGLRYEADGDLRRAERLLLQAFSVDQTYAPRFSLANFYFRHGNQPAFWAWARRAAEMPADDLGALFALCWRVAPDAMTIETAVVGNDPEVIRQFIDFLVDKGQGQAAVHPATHLIHLSSEETDQERITSLIDRLVAANDSADAETLWRELMREHWIPADDAIPYNHNFAHDPLPISLDWRLSAFPGMHSWPGPSGLMTDFTGDEPENCPIAEETISLSQGKYQLQSSFITQNIPPDSGIHWQILQPGSDTVVAKSSSLSGDKPGSVSMPFSVGPDQSLLHLQLVYERELGTQRIQGTLVVPSVRIQALR